MSLCSFVFVHQAAEEDSDDEEESSIPVAARRENGEDLPAPPPVSEERTLEGYITVKGTVICRTPTVCSNYLLSNS